MSATNNSAKLSHLHGSLTNSTRSRQFCRKASGKGSVEF